jgi:hypothetical protein
MPARRRLCRIAVVQKTAFTDLRQNSLLLRNVVHVADGTAIVSKRVHTLAFLFHFPMGSVGEREEEKRCVDA